MASANAGSGMPRRRQAIHAPTPPKKIAPQMPRPPSQIAKARSGSPPSPKYGRGLVITW